MDADDRNLASKSQLFLAGSKATVSGPALSPAPTPEAGTLSVSAGSSGMVSYVASSAGKKLAVPAARVPAPALLALALGEVTTASMVMTGVGEAVDVVDADDEVAGVACCGARFIRASPSSIIRINWSSLLERARMIAGSGSTTTTVVGVEEAMEFRCQKFRVPQIEVEQPHQILAQKMNIAFFFFTCNEHCFVSHYCWGDTTVEGISSK
ncbi:hypothetical protein BS78_04G237200 [Paspalum vaginatum]|nr:hypothetical protein BS78_04G237200 [Paspalum vaginatum]